MNALETIGIDDEWLPVLAWRVDRREVAEEFDRLFQGVYLTFHRRDAKRSQLSAASRAVLDHLALTGPLTVGEAAAHLDRAQSVVSEIVGRLENQGLLEREPDPKDRRRTLVWLTRAGSERIADDRRVLSAELLAPALARLPSARRRALLDGLQALLAAASSRPCEAEPETSELEETT